MIFDTETSRKLHNKLIAEILNKYDIIIYKIDEDGNIINKDELIPLLEKYEFKNICYEGTGDINEERWIDIVRSELSDYPEKRLIVLTPTVCIRNTQQNLKHLNYFLITIQLICGRR